VTKEAAQVLALRVQLPPRDLVLRVAALLRRTERLAGSQLLNQQVQIGDVPIDLGTPTQRLVGQFR
jgi:DNA-binding response OmpR family regulator